MFRMIRHQESPVIQTKNRVRAWISCIAKGERSGVAALAGVDEKTLRLAMDKRWNPTVATLDKLHAVIPVDFQPQPRRRRRRVAR